MADLSDVSRALAARLAAAIYPNGNTSPSAVEATVVVGTGWPVDADLTKNMKDGTAVVTVYPLPNMTTMSTRYSLEWTPLTQTEPTLTLTPGFRSVTIGGTAQAGLLVGIRAARIGYPYQVQASDTPETIASALAALVPGATATSATVSVPAATDFVARLAQPTACVQEVTRQKQQFQISLWCPTPELRDALGSLLGPVLAQDFIPLSDGTSGWLHPLAQSLDDRPETANLWIRHMRVSVEYGTTVTQVFPAMLFGMTALNVRDNETDHTENLVS